MPGSEYDLIRVDNYGFPVRIENNDELLDILEVTDQLHKDCIKIKEKNYKY